MKTAPLPANEPSRLHALQALKILDTPKDPRFDDLTHLAGLITACPIALVSLVDAGRQWFKSCVGLDAAETSRDIAFCAHAILGNGLMEVNDALRDERFHDNPLVVGAPHIRFYAGMPLISADGFAYGTLCVIDTRPRQLDSAQRDALQRLAQQVVYNMEVNRVSRLHSGVATQLASLLEFLPDGIITTDADGRIEEVNSIARQWHGVDPGSIPRSQWRRYFGLYDSEGMELLPLAANPLTRVLRGEVVRQQEIVIRAKGQADRIVVCNGDYLRSSDGRSAGAVVVMRDITDIRKRDFEIANARNYLEQLIDAAVDVSIIATDLDGTITLFNTGAERMLGYRAADMVGKHSPVILHLPREVERRSQELSTRHGYPVTGFDVFVHEVHNTETDTRQWTYVCRDGSHKQVRLSVSMLRDGRQQPIGYLGIAMNLTAQLQAEANASLNAERFQRAFSAAAQGMALVSISGRWIDVNRALCEMFGYTREELLTLDVHQLSHPEDMATDLELIRKTLEGSINQYQLEKRYLHKSGEIIHTILSVALLRDSVGRPVHFVSQIQDITALKRMERMKDEFVSTVSHELRTPLTSISGALSLIEGGVLGDVPESMQEMLAVATQNCQRLSALINDLLDMERLIAGKLPFTFADHSLLQLLDDAVILMQSYAEPLGVVLRRRGTDDLVVHVDAMRLTQVITNLLSNACKFSPPNSEVLLDHRRDGDAVEISVTDYGSGIPESFRSRIFQKFSQAESSSSRSKGGTGLGLVICKELMEQMGGEIGFESREGAGTRFWIRLPLQS